MQGLFSDPGRLPSASLGPHPGDACWQVASSTAAVLCVLLAGPGSGRVLRGCQNLVTVQEEVGVE